MKHNGNICNGCGCFVINFFSWDEVPMCANCYLYECEEYISDNEIRLGCDCGCDGDYWYDKIIKVKQFINDNDGSM